MGHGDDAGRTAEPECEIGGDYRSPGGIFCFQETYIVIGGEFLFNFFRLGVIIVPLDYRTVGPPPGGHDML